MSRARPITAEELEQIRTGVDRAWERWLFQYSLGYDGRLWRMLMPERPNRLVRIPRRSFSSEALTAADRLCAQARGNQKLFFRIFVGRVSFDSVEYKQARD